MAKQVSNIERLYNSVNKEYDLGTFDEFKRDMADPVKRGKLHQAIAANYDLPPLEKFSADMGYSLKKKDVSEPSASSGSANSTDSVFRGIDYNELVTKYKSAAKNEAKTRKEIEQKAKATSIAMDVANPLSSIIPKPLMSGMVDMATGVTGLVGGVLSAASKIDHYKPLKPVADKVMEFATKQQELSNDVTIASKSNMGIKSPEKSMVDHLSDGNIRDFGKSLAVDVAKTIPQIVATVASGGGTAAFTGVGALATGSAMTEEYSKDKDLSITDIAQSTAKGVVEGVVSKFFDLDILAGKTISKAVVGGLDEVLGAGGKALKQQIVENGKDAVKKEVVRGFKDILRAGTKGMGQEAVEEDVTVLANFVIDAIDEDKFNQKEYEKLIQDLGNTTLVSMATGGSMSMVAARMSQVNYTPEEKRSISTLQSILENPSASKETKAFAASKLEAIKQGNIDKSVSNFNKISKLDTETKLEVVERQAEIERMEADVEGISDVDTKDQLLDTIENKKLALIDFVSKSVPKPEDVAVSEVLKDKKSTESAIEEAFAFQPEAKRELTSPKVDKSATVFDAKGNPVSEVTVLDITEDGVLVEKPNGKQSTVPLNRISRTSSQIAEDFHSGDEATISRVSDIVKKDITDEEINKQRRMATQVEGRSIKMGIKIPPKIQAFYDRFLSSGDRSAVRAMELKESITSNAVDTIAESSNRLLSLIGKDPEKRKNASIVLSKDNIDDKIDSLTVKSTADAIASITGIDATMLQEAYDNPTAEGSVDTLMQVDEALKAKTENGTRGEVNALIEDAKTSDRRTIRDLSVKWANAERDFNNAKDIKAERNSIENELSALYGGDKIIEILKESRKNTILAKRELLKSPDGRKILSSVNEARESLENFAKWVDNSVAALNIKDRGIGESILANSGIYMKRTYEYWNDPDFKFDEKVAKQAIDSITESLLPTRLIQLTSTKKFQEAKGDKQIEMAQKLRAKAQKDASMMFSKYVAEITETKEFRPTKANVNSTKVSSKETMERDFISEHFGKFLGKTEDVVERFHSSALAQARIISSAEMGAMIENLSGERFFDSESEALARLMEDGMTETEAGVELGKNYKQVNDKYSPLDGRIMPRGIYDTIYEPTIQHSNQLFNVLKGLSVMWRIGKTVLDPSGHINNATGGHVAIAEQGHVIDKDTLRFLADRFRLMKGTNRISQESMAIKSKMVDTGIWGSNVDIGQIKFLLKHYDDIAGENANITTKGMSQLKKLFTEKFGSVKRYYSATDDLSKLILFHKKKDVFARKLYGKEYNELTAKEEAIVDANIGERVKQNMPTMSRLPKFARSIIGSVVLGDFQGFRFGAFTSFINTITNAIDDIHRGHSDSTLSAEQKKAYLEDGYRTLAGSLMIFKLNSVWGASILAASAVALGKMSDVFKEEEGETGTPIGSKMDMYQEMKNTWIMPDYYQGMNIVAVSDNGSGVVDFVNFSNTFPNDESYKILGAQENLPMFNFDNMANSGVGSTFVDTFAPNAVMGIYRNVMEGKDSWGNELDNTMMARMGYVVGEFSPASIKNINKRATEYAKNKAGDKPEYGERDSRRVTLLNYLSGVLRSSPQLIKRTYNIDLSRQVYYRMKDFYEKEKIKFESLTESEKYERIKKLEPVRKSYLLLKKYEIHSKGKFDADEAFNNAFQGRRGLVSQEEKNYILTGEKPEIED